MTEPVHSLRSEEQRPPAHPLPSEEGLARCRVCAATLDVLSLSAAAGLPGICPKCQEEIRAQEQPIPGYHVVREIGRGSMGVVALALRDADGALVALKTIIPVLAGSPSQVERFL